MNKLEILKGAAEFVVSVGVGSIVGNAIKVTTSPDSGRFKKISIGVGGFILSRMVSDLAVKYTNNEIDDVAVKIQKIFNPNVVVVDPPETDVKKEVPSE